METKIFDLYDIVLLADHFIYQIYSLILCEVMHMLTQKQRNTFLEIKGTTQAGTPGTLKSNKSSGSEGFFQFPNVKSLVLFTQDNACDWISRES